MSTVTRQWLMQQQRHPCVHKWEKRWVSKGNMMIFKWVRTENRAGTGTAEEKEVDFPAEDPSLAEGFLGEGGGTRRLTRGKAADMGITVESIADTNDALLGRAAPGENPRAGKHEDGSSVSPADPSAETKASEHEGEGGKKRRRDEDGGEEAGDGEAKRSRVDAPLEAEAKEDGEGTEQAGGEEEAGAQAEMETAGGGEEDAGQDPGGEGQTGEEEAVGSGGGDGVEQGEEEEAGGDENGAEREGAAE